MSKFSISLSYVFIFLIDLIHCGGKAHACHGIYVRYFSLSVTWATGIKLRLYDNKCLGPIIHLCSPCFTLKNIYIHAFQSLSFAYVCVHACTCMFKYMLLYIHRGQKSSWDPLDIELQEFLSDICLLTSCLDSNSGPHGCPTGTLNH